MKTLDTTFTLEKNRKIGAQPVWILKCPFASSGTYYLSDHIFAVDTWNSGVTTKSWVSSWGAIDENISFGVGASQVSTFSVNIIIDQNSITDIGDILWTAANNIETIDCELYLWFNGLSGASDPPELMWTGNIVDFRQINEQEYQVEFADQSVKKNKIIGNLLNTTTYTRLPAKNVGKVGPIIYGTVTKSPAVCISCGGFTRLAEDLDTSETGVDVVDGSVFPASGAFTVNVDGEVMTCSSRSGNTLTVTRSTTPVTHATGAPVVETSDIIYMVADHPVNAIDHVYLNGEEFTDCTKYTGQSGDEHATYTGKAIVVFNHGANLETAILTVTGQTCTDAHWTNDAYATDDNEVTYANNHGNDNSYMYGTFTDRPEFAAVKQQRADWHWYVAEDGAWYLRESMGGSLRTTPYMDSETFDGWSPYLAGGLYNGPIGIAAESCDDLNVYELRQKEVQYYPYSTSGENAEDVIVGGTISCDVDGYQDDGSGTYTGTPDALIERPDHIFKHFLYTYLGLAIANFSTDAAASFAADSYKFGMSITEQRTAKEWLSKMAWECRCYFRWALGKAYLLYRPDTLSSDKTVTAAMIGQIGNNRSSVRVERSPLDEVINKVRAKYKRNWSESGDEAYSMLYEASDTASITRYGEKENIGLFEWDFVNSSAMAADVGAFYLARYKERKKVVSMDLFLDNCELEFGDVVTITPLSSLVVEAQKVNIYPGSGQSMRVDKINLIGKEY